jgi:hypothetical protein
MEMGQQVAGQRRYRIVSGGKRQGYRDSIDPKELGLSCRGCIDLRSRLTPQHSGHSGRSAREHLGRRSPLCGSQLPGRTPAGSSEQWSTPDRTTLLLGIEDLYHQVAGLSAEQDRLCPRFRKLRFRSRDPCSKSSDPRPGSRNRRPGSRFHSRGDTAPAPCWYCRR